MFGIFTCEHSIGEQGNGTRIRTSKDILNIKFTKGVKAIFAGGYSSGALTIDDELYLWGSNFYGNIPSSSDESILVPTPFNNELISNKKVHSVAFGIYHSLFLTKDGFVFSCGTGRCGKLGLGSTEDHRYDPCLIRNLKNITHVECGDGHSIAYNAKKLYTWGGGFNGRLGHGIMNYIDRVCKDLTIPKRVELSEGISRAGCGDKYSVVLDHTMKVRVAGNLDSKKIWYKDDFVIHHNII